MSHYEILVRFRQQDSEPLHNTWWRFKNLLRRLPYHGFSREGQLDIFLNGLNTRARVWVEKGNGNISFYQQSIDQAYFMLDNMAEFDYHCWNCSMNNYGWENDSNMTELGFYGAQQQQAASLEELVRTLAINALEFQQITYAQLQSFENHMSYLATMLSQLEANILEVPPELIIEESLPVFPMEKTPHDFIFDESSHEDVEGYESLGKKMNPHFVR